MSRPKPSKKPKRLPSLSDPATLSEMALRLQEGIYITTMEGEIVDANPAFLEMFGVVKQYNDTNGHVEGDSVLVKMARFLMRHVRAEESVVRVGGDEFLVVLCDTGEEQTRQVAGRLRTAAPDSAPAQFSMGWAARRKGETFEDTMERADHRLLEVRIDERRDAPKKRRSRAKD